MFESNLKFYKINKFSYKKEEEEKKKNLQYIKF